MARPKEYDEPRVTAQVRIPSDLHKRLRAEARRREVSANLLVMWAISRYLDDLEGRDPVTGERYARSTEP